MCNRSPKFVRFQDLLGESWGAQGEADTMSFLPQRLQKERQYGLCFCNRMLKSGF